MFNLKKHRSAEKVLRDTIDVLNERGWKRGAGWRWQDEPGPVCVEGAMLQALNVNHREKDVLYRHPAYLALKKHLGRKLNDVWDWNDHSTQKEVLRVLRTVAGVQDTAVGHYELVQNFLAYKARQAKTVKQHVLAA